MGGSFSSSHRLLRDCYFLIIAIFTGVPSRSLCGGERYKKWCLLCDNQIWFPFLDARVIKKRGVETCLSRIEPVRHSVYFFRFKVNIVAPFIHRWGHLRCPSANMQDGSIWRCQHNWSFAEFEENCFRKRLCNFWQSGRRKLHVFCNLRTAGVHTRSETLSWKTKEESCPLPEEESYTG